MPAVAVENLMWGSYPQHHRTCAHRETIRQLKLQQQMIRYNECSDAGAADCRNRLLLRLSNRDQVPCFTNQVLGFCQGSVNV